MIKQGGYGDNLRPVDSLEGIVFEVMDFVKDEYRSKAGKENLNEVHLNVLKELKNTAKSVDNLMVNDDFILFVKYIQRGISVCERYVYHPSITQEAKSVWFNQLTVFKGIINVLDHFRNNNDLAYQALIEDKLMEMNESYIEGEE